ncbi:MAG: hypothetical protein ABEI74_03010 [Candidatus Pacearchaeota archaeon]
MKNSKKRLLYLIVFLSIFYISIASADIVSINSGGSKTTAITPSKNIEGFFLGGKEQEVPSSDDGGSGGGSGGGGPPKPKKEENKTDNFKLDKDSIKVTLNPNENTQRCFTATNLKDEAIFGLEVGIQGKINKSTDLNKQQINLMAEMSERVCIDFSSQGLKETTKKGEVKVSKNETKKIDLTMKVETRSKEESETGGSSDSDREEKNETTPDPIKDVRGIETLILWLPLLLAILIFLIIKKYSQFMKSISGKKTREEKIAQVERIKRASQRSDKNILESIVNKAAIYLANKTVGRKEEEEVHFS